MATAFSLKPQTSGFICRRNSRGQRLALLHGILSPQGLHFGHSVSSTDAATQPACDIIPSDSFLEHLPA